MMTWWKSAAFFVCFVFFHFQLIQPPHPLMTSTPAANGMVRWALTRRRHVTAFKTWRRAPLRQCEYHGRRTCETPVKHLWGQRGQSRGVSPAGLSPHWRTNIRGQGHWIMDRAVWETPRGEKPGESPLYPVCVWRVKVSASGFHVWEKSWVLVGHLTGDISFAALDVLFLLLLICCFAAGAVDVLLLLMFYCYWQCFVVVAVVMVMV